MGLSPEDRNLIRKTYLGDGAYAGFDGYQVWLWAERRGTIHMLALDVDVAGALMRYLPDAFRQTLTDEERKELRGE